jgi:1-acyl-sn-glycerol-3-phosphate acyltransferase
MAFTKQSFGVLITTMTQWWSPTTVRVSGDTSIPKQLFRKADGGLECRFPKRLVMMANHQLYTDWLYLWWIAYTNNMHGYVYIILKESLKNLPLVGWGAQFYNFIFLSRKWEQDLPQFQKNLDKLNNAEDPMWLLMFPEGTNLATSTREKSKAWAAKAGIQDMKHQLLPRSRGLQLCLQRLRKTTPWLYDCTIAYEGVPEGQYGQDIFTLQSSLFEGRPPKSVNMHFRRFKVSTIPIDNDKAFEVWLRNRWREKDYLLEHFYRFQTFPKDELWMVKQTKLKGRFTSQPARFIETQIKSNNSEEFLSIFAPLASVLSLSMLLSGNADVNEVMKMLDTASRKGQQQTINKATGLIAPNQATLSTIGRLTPPAAEQELILRYFKSMKPSIPLQLSTTRNQKKGETFGTGSKSAKALPIVKKVASEPATGNKERSRQSSGAQYRKVTVSPEMLLKMRQNVLTSRSK